MPSALRHVWPVAAFILIGSLAGCGGTELQVAPGGKELPANEDSAEFIDRIASQASVSENDAARGILLLLDGKDAAPNFQKRVESLRARQIVDSRWDFSAARPITKGKFAYMICQAGGVPGGVMLTVLGPTRRYCLRELQYRDVMVQGSMFTSVTGLEYVSVLTRADVYKRTGKFPKTTGNTE